MKQREGQQASCTGNDFATNECFADAHTSVDVVRTELTF